MRLSKLLSVMLPVALALSSSHCVRVADGSTRDLQGLRRMGSTRLRFGSTHGVSAIRQEAIAETALSVGAQSGLSRRYQEIDRVLESRARDLDVTFNFESLLLEHNVQPPVLLEGHDTYKKSSDSVLRISDRHYYIKHQARFVPIAPNWRNYVYRQYSDPEPPHITLLPRNKAERAIWNKYVAIGWNRGVVQANRIFQDNLALLKEDYNGMILYRKLLAQGMVSKPFVAVTEMGVTTDDKHLSINDKILRIAVMPKFEGDAKQWNPALSTKTLNYAMGGMTKGIPGKEYSVPKDAVKVDTHIISYER